MTNIERSLIDLADAIIRARIRFEQKGYKALIETGKDKVRLHVQRN